VYSTKKINSALNSIIQRTYYSLDSNSDDIREGSEESTTRSVAKNKWFKRIGSQKTKEIVCLDYNCIKKFLASDSIDGEVNIYQALKSSNVVTLLHCCKLNNFGRDKINDFSWSTDSGLFGVGCNYGTRIFKAYDSYIDEVGKFDEGDVCGISFHPFHNHVLASSSSPTGAIIFRNVVRDGDGYSILCSIPSKENLNLNYICCQSVSCSVYSIN